MVSARQLDGENARLFEEVLALDSKLEAAQDSVAILNQEQARNKALVAVFVLRRLIKYHIYIYSIYNRAYIYNVYHMRYTARGWASVTVCLLC